MSSPQYKPSPGEAPLSSVVAWRKLVGPQYDYSDRYRYREDHGIGAPEGWEPLYAEPQKAPERKWQPIASAPKDRRIELWFPASELIEQGQPVVIAARAEYGEWSTDPTWLGRDLRPNPHFQGESESVTHRTRYIRFPATHWRDIAADPGSI